MNRNTGYLMKMWGVGELGIYGKTEKFFSGQSAQCPPWTLTRYKKSGQMNKWTD